MDNVRRLNTNFEMAAWGALFIWWGITELFKFLPVGTGVITLGVILLGREIMRTRNA
jgi:hypothetical protein